MDAPIVAATKPRRGATHRGGYGPPHYGHDIPQSRLRPAPNVEESGMDAAQQVQEAAVGWTLIIIIVIIVLAIIGLLSLIRRR